MTDRARLDADGTAAPKTKLVGHVREGGRVGPGITKADAIEDVATGERTGLHVIDLSPRAGAGKTVCVGAMSAKRLWLHVTVQDGIETKAFASLKSGSELRDYFANYVGELPYRFPAEFSTVWVKYASEDGTRGEVWQWGPEDCMVDCGDALPEDGGGRGYMVEVDGKLAYSTWDGVEDADNADEEEDE